MEIFVLSNIGTMKLEEWVTQFTKESRNDLVESIYDEESSEVE